jgi:hypothetical protein
MLVLHRLNSGGTVNHDRIANPRPSARRRRILLAAVAMPLATVASIAAAGTAEAKPSVDCTAAADLIPYYMNEYAYASTHGNWQAAEYWSHLVSNITRVC